jgi:signal transduction histidine kinase
VNERHQTLHVECPDDVGRAEGDFGLLLIVLRNLVSNAIRFTPDGGRISVSAARTSGIVKIRVTDTGIGMEPAHQSLIFEKFYEVASSLNHSSGDYEFKSGGLGLGLATVKAILQAHGSACELDSKPGQGSTFSFSLPAV